MKTCEHCNGAGDIKYPGHHQTRFCPVCQGVGAFGVPTGPTMEWPGTPGKVAILAARVAADEPLFHERDAGAGFRSSAERMF